MKVLHLISSGGFYGAERVILTLSKAMNRAGHASTIGVFHNSHRPNTEIAADAQSSNLPVELIRCNGRFDWGAVRTLRAVVQKAEPQVLHTHGYKADIYGYLAARSSDIALVSTCHGWLDNDLKDYAYGMLDRAVLRRFKMIVAVSESIATRLRGAGLPKEKIRIIDNGIDVEAFSQGQPTLSQRYGANQRLVGLIGRLDPNKGIQYFLAAAAVVIRSHSNAEFIVIGEGPERDNLARAARQLGIQDKVYFTGKLANMAGVFASLEIVVSSSLKEGLPMNILEALAAKRPIVATAVGAVPRVIMHEQTGLLVPPADVRALASAIIRLLNDRELGEALAARGWQIVRTHFSAEAMTAQYLSLYADVIAPAR